MARHDRVHAELAREAAQVMRFALFNRDLIQRAGERTPTSKKVKPAVLHTGFTDVFDSFYE